jgi:hypothetical protein
MSQHFLNSIIGGNLKAEKQALWAALQSTACGGASRRCAAPIAAARALRATPPGRYAPSALRAQPFTNTKTSQFSGHKALGTLV